MNLLGVYKNGNFATKIFSDGTKIRETEDDEFIPEFAENMDIKISNYCDMGCKFCHEGSTKNGKHGDVLNQKFIETLHPYQEVALGGGDATSHPDLIPFLHKLKDRKVIVNMTVNQQHFEQKQELIKKLVWLFTKDTQKCALTPTQKPVALVEEIIKTYTNEGETVLDSTAGSMTTGIAAIKTGRNVICVEKDKEIFDLGKNRVLECKKNRGDINIVG